MDRQKLMVELVLKKALQRLILVEVGHTVMHRCRTEAVLDIRLKAVEVHPGLGDVMKVGLLEALGVQVEGDLLGLMVY